jgi:hypothetical protein
MSERRAADQLKSPADVQAQLQAERSGATFVVYRDGEGVQQLVALEDGAGQVLIGRDEASDICLAWDKGVSGVHARLERAGRFWTLHDDGLSRNGSYVNGERVHGYRVLRDSDELCFGGTIITYRSSDAGQDETTIAVGAGGDQAVSPAQRKVLIELCRPYKGRPAFARPATNQEIADGLVLSVEAVKSHLRLLFARFGLEKLPANEKRMRLAEYALEAGIVQQHEL